MGICKYTNVDLVSHAGDVWGVVVVAEDAKLLALADSRLGDVGHAVVGDAVGFSPTLPLECAPTGLK